MPPFTRLAEHYDLKYRDSDFSEVVPVELRKYPRDRIEMAVKLASTNASGKLLEIASGNGSVLLTLLDKYDELVGTELSTVRLRQLGLLFEKSDKVELIHNDLENEPLPFPEAEFGTVLMIAVIEHLVDPVSALRKIHRVLKPGGRLILDTPNIAKWTRRIKLAAGFFPATASFDEGLLCYDKQTPTELHDDGHLHYFTFRSLRRLAIDRARFSGAEIHGYGSSFLCRRWPEMFSEISMVLYK